MDVETIFVSAAVGIASVITAWVTTRFKMREERDKWERDLLWKYTELSSRDREAGDNLAAQLAMGYLDVEPPDGMRRKVFIPKHANFTIGSKEGKNLVLNYGFVSRDHAVIIHEGSSLVLVNQGTKHVRLKGKLVDRVTLQPGDVFYIANVAITFHKL